MSPSSCHPAILHISLTILPFMKKLNTVYMLFFTVASAIVFLSNFNNPPNGNTGAPPTFSSCNGCHSGPINGNIAITGLPATIAPNSTYPISVTLTRTNMTPQLAGFQFVVQDADNNASVGSLANPSSGAQLEVSGTRTYFEHDLAQSFGAGNTVTFTVDWTAPATATGNITMYAAGNLANGNNGTSGDGIVTTTSTGALGGGGGGVISVNVTSNNVSCFGGNNGTATANPSGGGGGPYTYMWSNGATTQTATNLTAGAYSVTVTNAAGGNGTGSANINQPSQVTAAIVNTTNVTCLSPVGSATALGSGGTGNITYSWPNGSSNATANLPAGTHTVTVSDANGCTATASANIQANTTPPLSDAGPAGTIGCGSPTTVLNGIGSAGTDFTYLWTTTNGVIVSGATTLNPTVSASGTYTLTVTNLSNGCTSSDNTTVSADFTAPTSNAGVDKTVTCSQPTTQLVGTQSSSGSQFTYLWTTSNGNIVSGATTPTATVDQGGVYCLLVTNTVNGCTASDCATVTEDQAPPVANAGSASPLTCSTTSVTLNGSASSSGSNFSYLWTTTASGNIQSGATTTMPVVTQPAPYTLTVTNSTNGCTAAATVTVTANTTPPNADAGPGMSLNCNNNAVVLNGSGSSQGGNFSYAWTGPGVQSGGNTPSPTVNTAGTYQILVTNTTTGCSATDSTTVTQTPALQASIPVKMDVTCNGNNNGSAGAAGTGGAGGYDFVWSNGDTTSTINGLAAGNYSVTITDLDGCSSSASVVIGQPAILSANASAVGESAVGANDGSATAAPTGGIPPYTYTWSNGSGNQTITGLAAGTYSVTVTDENGCASVQSVTVASFNCGGFAVSLSSTNPTCSGGSNGMVAVAAVGGSSPYNYLWSNGSTESSQTGLPAGSYTITATDGNGCEATGNITLTAPAALNLSIDQQENVACNGQANGSATIGAAGGTPGYTFAWSNGGTSASQNNLAAGNYTVTVTDQNACTAAIPIVISQPNLLTGNATATGETAVGANNGTASMSVAGGVAPYAYLWSNGSTDPTINGLVPGEYCVTVTDANNCSVTDCSTVAQFGCVGTSLVVGSSNVSCFGGNNGSAQVMLGGFSDPVVVAWSNGASGTSVGNLPAGTYTMTVTDANGCTAAGEIQITQPPLLELSLLNLINPDCAGENTGEISVNGTGGTPGYVFSWSNGSVMPTISNLAAGDYQVTLSDANNCTQVAEFTIAAPPDNEPPVVIAAGLTVALSASGTASITTSSLDGGSFDNCSLDSIFISQTDFDCNHVGGNTVVLTGIDAAGNMATDTTTVFVVDDIPPTITCPANVSVTIDDCEAAVDYESPVATDNCDSVTLFILTGLPSGAVFPSGTTQLTWGADDHHGNTVFCTFSITVISDFAATATFVEPACFGFDDATATAAPVGGVPPYGYEWDDPANQTTPTATGLSAGTYTVNITDSEGCVASSTITITEPSSILVSVDQVTPETNDSMNGAISISATGGTGGVFTYEWTLNGAFFSNSEDLTGLAAGNYVLVTTDQTNCSVTDTVVVERFTGTQQLDLARLIRLAPNPASDRLVVSFDLGQAAEVNIQLYDLGGKAVGTQFRDFTAKKAVQLDVSGLPAGLYFVKAIVDGQVWARRVVIAKH